MIGVTAEQRAQIENELAQLVTEYCRREIGVLMQQAEYWAANGKPLAVHHRLAAADRVFQFEVLFDPARQANGWPPAFDNIREILSRPEIKPAGRYPADKELGRYSDPRYAVAKFEGRA